MKEIKIKNEDYILLNSISRLDGVEIEELFTDIIEGYLIHRLHEEKLKARRAILDDEK